MNPFGNFIGSASIPEILWTMAAIDLFYISRLNHGEALVDREALKDIKNGRRKMVEMNLYVARIFMGIAVLKFGIGLVALLSYSRSEPTFAGVLIVSVLVVSLIAADLAMREIRNFRIYINEHGMQSRDESGRFVREE